jgi:hypothetical protein
MLKRHLLKPATKQALLSLVISLGLLTPGWRRLHLGPRINRLRAKRGQ